MMSVVGLKRIVLFLMFDFVGRSTAPETDLDSKCCIASSGVRRLVASGMCYYLAKILRA